MSPRTRRFIAAVSAMLLLGTMTMAPAPVVAQPATVTATQADQQGPVDRRLLLVGVGAIAGVLAFNVLTAPFGTVPLAGGVLEVVPENVALGSRLIAVLAAGAGAIGGTWLYDRWIGETSNYGYMGALVVGALGGVAVGNYLYAGTVGYPPYYAGAGVANGATTMASSAAQAASRVYVVAMGVFGTWVADWMYRR